MFVCLLLLFFKKKIKQKNLSIFFPQLTRCCAAWAVQRKRGERRVWCRCPSSFSGNIVMETRPPPYFCLASYQVYYKRFMWHSALSNAERGRNAVLRGAVKHWQRTRRREKVNVWISDSYKSEKSHISSSSFSSSPPGFLKPYSWSRNRCNNTNYSSAIVPPLCRTPVTTPVYLHV